MNVLGYKYGYYGDYYWGFGFFWFLILFVFLDLVLRGFALWRSARKNQTVWFIFLLLINSMGILPIIYLLTNKEDAQAKKNSKATTSKKK